MTTTEATQTRDALIAELGLTLTAEFVPFSKSRNAKPNPKISDLSLNWKVTLERRDPTVGAGNWNAHLKMPAIDYQEGIGHAPSYKERLSVDGAEAVRRECETGTKAIIGGYFKLSGNPLAAPSIADVLYCLLSDASVIDCATFEEWASGLGFDPDSRKAEKTYQDCLKQALALRRLLGDANLARLQEAFQDY